MIGYIFGKILEVSQHHVLVLTDSGVGYDIGINEITFGQLAISETAELYIHHHITEGAQSLFGFITLDEKKLFMELIKISGIGGKVALQILSLGKQKLIQAVQQDDKKVIEGIKGIGKKMAEKIVLELKDKDFVTSYIGIVSTSDTKKGLEQTQLPATLIDNIKTTLVNMGYQSRDIERVLQTLPEEYSTLEQILPFMIREL